MNKKKNNYINNARFYEEMVKYKAAYIDAEERGIEKPRLSNYIGECFLLIAAKLTNHAWFIGYSYKDEMMGDAYENCVRYAHCFDTDKFTNPFAYFTRVVWFAFRNRIKKERRQLYIKLKNMEHHYIIDALRDEGVFDDGGMMSMTELDYEKNNHFIYEYEKTLTEQKEKSRIAAKNKREKNV